MNKKLWHVVIDVPLEDFGSRIRFFRLYRDLSYRDMAERCGCSHTAIQKFETGKLNPDTARVIKIAHALNVPVAAFFAKRFRLEATD